MRKIAMIFLPAALLTAPLVLAAPPPKMPPIHPPAQRPAPHVDTATLHKFASAYQDIMGLRMRYLPKIRAAKTGAKKNAIKQQAMKVMKQHISKYMPVSEYIKVGKEVNASAKLRKRLTAILRANQKTSKSVGKG